MNNRSFLYMGGLLAVTGLIALAPGCGGDDTGDATTTTGGTTGGMTTGEMTTGGMTTGGMTTGGMTTGGMTTGGMTTGMGGTPTCAAYCTAIMTNCTDANAQYSDEAACLASCAALDLGMSNAETSGNTVGCREYHAGAAMGEPSVHCVHAGPLGGGACGDAPGCEAFCQIAEAECPDAYGTEAECVTACGMFTPGMYSTAATAGDTLACRMYHLQVATGAPDPHCGHVGPMTGGMLPCK